MDSKEFELKYLLDDEQRLKRLMALVGPELRERVEPLLARVQTRIQEIRQEQDSEMPRAA